MCCSSTVQVLVMLLQVTSPPIAAAAKCSHSYVITAYN